VLKQEEYENVYGNTLLVPLVGGSGGAGGRPLVTPEVVVTVAERCGASLCARYDISPNQSPAESTEIFFLPTVTAT